MSHKGALRFSVVAVLLVGLVLGTCLTALAEAASHTSQICAVVKGEELSSSKTVSGGLLAVLVEHHVLPRGLSRSKCSPLDLTADLISANLWGDLSPRAPPPLL